MLLSLMKKLQKIINSGLDIMIYSFDGGTKSSYEKMRPGRFKENTFNKVIKNIRKFSEVKNKLNAKFPRTKNSNGFNKRYKK